MSVRRLKRLMLWEFEENWRKPVLEVIVAIAIFAYLAHPPIRLYGLVFRFKDLGPIISFGWIFQVIATVLVFSRSLAEWVDRREALVMLSYPVKKMELLLSKFSLNFLLISAIFLGAFLAQGPLHHLSIFEPALHLATLTLLIQLTFLSTLSAAISLLVKHMGMATLLLLALIYGLGLGLGGLDAPYKYMSPPMGSLVIFDFLISKTYLTPTPYRFEDFLTALGFPLLSSLASIIFAITYFKIMELD